MSFPANLKEYLSSEGFGDMINFIHKSPTKPDSYIYLNNNSQSTIDLNIQQHPNDSIKSGIAYTIADYVNTEVCKAIVLIEPETKLDKKLVKSLIKVPNTSSTLNSKYTLWAPVIEFLIKDLKRNSKEINKTFLELLEYTSNNLEMSISDIFSSYAESYDTNFDFTLLEFKNSESVVSFYLYFAVIKETMKLEDLRYPRPAYYGKNFLKFAYEELALNNMDYEEWRTFFHFKKNNLISN